MKIFGNTVTVQGEKLSIRGGILKGALNMAGHVLNGIAAPTEDDHAANKKYVDYTSSNMKEYADGLTSYITADLAADKWTGDKAPYRQSVTAKGVTNDNAVIVGPAEASRKVYIEAAVHCAAQEKDSLTFECEEKPTAALTVNILIVE